MLRTTHDKCCFRQVLQLLTRRHNYAIETPRWPKYLVNFLSFRLQA